MKSTQNITVNSVNGKLLGSFGRTGAGMSIADKIKAAAAKASASGATSGGSAVASTPEVTTISSQGIKANAKSGK